MELYIAHTAARTHYKLMLQVAAGGIEYPVYMRVNVFVHNAVKGVGLRTVGTGSIRKVLLEE